MRYIRDRLLSYAIPLLAILLFVLLLFGDQKERTIEEWGYLGQLKLLSKTLQGLNDRPTDIHADIIGFRGIIENKNAYPIIGPALREIGIHWDVRHAHTHPPTAFLFVAPISYLPINAGLTVWGYLMIGCIFMSMLLYGFNWRWSLFLTSLSLYWTPITLSFGQITLIWMLGLAIAFKYRNDISSVSGIGIGIASLTKFLPLITLFPFICRKKWQTILSAVLVWIAALVIVLIFNYETVFEYIVANKVNVSGVPTRSDNASLLIGLHRILGFPGLVIMGLSIVGIVCLNRNDFFTSEGISSRCFMFFSWLSVALLPIAWVYSLAPLFPVLLYFILQKNIVSTLLCLIVLLLPLFNMPWGNEFVPVSYFCTVTTGALFVIDRLPVKYCRLTYKGPFINVFG